MYSISINYKPWRRDESADAAAVTVTSLEVLPSPEVLQMQYNY